MSHINVLWHYVAHIIECISSVSTSDFVDIVATYISQTSGKTEFDPTLNSRGYSPEALAEAKKLKEKKFSSVSALGLKFTKPLSNFKCENIGYLWTLFENYERGQLPYPGSISEQPAQIIEIFGVFQALKNEQIAKERKRQEQDGRHKYQSKPRARR
jgi:hypothetical protein